MQTTNWGNLLAAKAIIRSIPPSDSHTSHKYLPTGWGCTFVSGCYQVFADWSLLLCDWDFSKWFHSNLQKPITTSWGILIFPQRPVIAKWRYPVFLTNWHSGKHIVIINVYAKHHNHSMGENTILITGNMIEQLSSVVISF